MLGRTRLVHDSEVLDHGRELDRQWRRHQRSQTSRRMAQCRPTVKEVNLLSFSRKALTNLHANGGNHPAKDLIVVEDVRVALLPPLSNRRRRAKVLAIFLRNSVRRPRLVATLIGRYITFIDL